MDRKFTEEIYEIRVGVGDKPMIYTVGRTFKAGSKSVHITQIYKEENLEVLTGNRVYVVLASVDGGEEREWKSIENCPVIVTYLS